MQVRETDLDSEWRLLRENSTPTPTLPPQEQRQLTRYVFFSPQATAPLCQVHNMPTPTLLFVGSNDVLGDPADVEALKPKISNLLHYEVIPGWNHLDFLYGIDASKLLYPKIVSVMKSMK